MGVQMAPATPTHSSPVLSTARTPHQSQLRVGAGVHTKLKIARPESQHGSSFPGQDRGADEGIGEARPGRHRHQVRACAVLAVQGVDEGRQLVCVGFLGGRGRRSKETSAAKEVKCAVWGAHPNSQVPGSVSPLPQS